MLQMTPPVLFVAARTLAQPVCTAADSQTANSGSTMNASRNIRRRWCNMAIRTIFTAGYGTIATDGFKNLKIRG